MFQSTNLIFFREYPKSEVAFCVFVFSAPEKGACMTFSEIWQKLYAAVCSLYQNNLVNLHQRTSRYVVPRRRIDTGHWAVQTYERRLPTLYFLANRNFGNFEFATKDEAIVDAPWVRIYVLPAYLSISGVGLLHIHTSRGPLPLLIQSQWFRRPRLVE